MTSESELRDAAAFIVKESQFEASDLIRVAKCARTLANHILATLRDDRENPVTEEWLESVGFRFDRDADVHQGTFPDSNIWATLRLDDFHRWEWSFDARWIFRSPTNRGEVRKLFRLLGFKLKESVNG